MTIQHTTAAKLSTKLSVELFDNDSNRSKALMSHYTINLFIMTVKVNLREETLQVALKT